MADRQQVRADLVRAPGLERHPQQRVLGQRALGLEVGDRVVRVVGVGGDPRPHAAVAAERRVDRAAPRRRAALDQREVLAGDLARAQRRLQRGVRRLVAGEHAAARTCRGRAGARRRGARGPARRPRGRRAPARASPAALPWPGWTTTPGGLVDHDQVLVLVGDPRTRAGGDVGLRRASGSGARVIVSPPASTWRLGLGTPSTRTSPASISLCALARDAGGVGQEDVQPLAGGLLGHAQPVTCASRAPTSSESTPNVTAMSATLNAGQCGNLMKSVTAPSADAVDQVARRAAEQQAGRQPHQPPVQVGDEERRAARRARRRR